MDPWKTSIEHGSEDGTFRLVDGDQDLTFDRSIAEEEDIALCTYSVPEFERLMSLPEPRPRVGLLRLGKQVDRKMVGYYGWMDGRWQPIKSLVSLRSLLDSTPPAEAMDIGQAVRMFETTAGRES